MNFTVYSKKDCEYCYKVKKVLELTGSTFVIYTLGEDFTEKEFRSQFGERSTFPQVVVGDIHIGGCIDTIEYLKENSIINT
jgi:glutaredoxin